MPELNKCGAAGVFFSLVGVILAIVAVATPEVVQVFLITDEAQIADSTLIAGIGIFNSKYDATEVNPALLAESGVPNKKFSTPTLEFPLLFGIQQNFLLEMFAVDGALVQQLGGIVPTSDVEIFSSTVNEVNKLEFEECSPYVAEAEDAVTDVFRQLHEKILPNAVAGISALVINQVNEAIEATRALVDDSATNVAQAFLSTTLDEAMDGAAAIAGCEDLEFTSLVEKNSTGTCVAGGLTKTLPAFEGKNISITAINSLAAHYVSGECDDLNFTVAECFEVVGFALNGTGFISRVDLDGDLGVDFCTLVGLCPRRSISTESTESYLEIISELLVEIGTEEALDGARALALYFSSVRNRAFQLGVGIFDSVEEATATSPVREEDNDFPRDLTAFYEPCTLLKFIQVATGIDLGLAGEGTRCSFIEYWGAAAKMLAQDPTNELADSFSFWQQSYERCFKVFPDDDDDLGDCREIFVRTWLRTAMSTEADPFDVNFGGEALTDCEFSDKEAISMAQTLVVVALSFHVLAFISGVAGVLMKNFPVVIGISALISLAAAVFIISSLLTLRFAPVYNKIERPPAGVFPEPFFKEGSGVIILELTAAVMLIATGCFSATVCQMMRGSQMAEKEQISATEMKMKDEEPEMKDEDIVPGTDTSI